MTIGEWAFNGFDIAVLLVCLISLSMAASRGLMREIISIIAMIVGIIVTLIVWGQFRLAAQDFISPNWLADGVLGAASFFGSYMVVVFILGGLTKKDSEVSFVNRLLGAGFGAFRGLIIAALVTMLLNSSYRDKLEMAEEYGAPTPELSGMLEGSTLYPILDKIGEGIRALPFSRLKSASERLKEGDIEGAIEEIDNDKDE